MTVNVKIKRDHNNLWQWHAYDEQNQHFASSEGAGFPSEDKAMSDSSWRLLCVGITSVTHSIVELAQPLPTSLF